MSLAPSVPLQQAPSEPGTRRWARALAWLILLFAAALLLAACGGGSGGDSDGVGDLPPPPPVVDDSLPPPPGVDDSLPPPPGVDDSLPPPPPARGQLLAASELAPLTAGQVAAAVPQELAAILPLAPRYDVHSYKLSYYTENTDGELVQASGLLAVPQKPLGQPSPVLSYQHGTVFYNDESPSRRIHEEEPPMLLAAMGFIVVAADYIGLGDSVGLPHPYLLSKPTAHAVIDMLSASAAWRQDQQVADNGQLYLLGYSEGGYATMAAQRELSQTNDPLLNELVASLPGAGPYDAQATLDGLLEQIRKEYDVLRLIRPGGLLHASREVRDEVRRRLERKLIPNDADISFDTRVLDEYLADDREDIYEYSSVHWGWTPTVPVYLFHGADDRTVPIDASYSALSVLQQAGGAPVVLKECGSAQPAGHLECVPEYLVRALDLLAQTAEDLQ